MKASQEIANMCVSPEGIKHLKEVEGCRLEAYQDTVGVWTIGYGHTGPEVKKGLKISQQEADELLASRLNLEFEPAVNNAIDAPITQLQFDALVSFCYNVGVAAFTNSSMVKKINVRDFVGAVAEFDRWHKPKEIIGRRNKEKAMFERGMR